MQTLVIVCDVLNSFGQHWQWRGRVSAQAQETRRASHSLRQLTYWEDWDICVRLFFFFSFFVNALESKRQNKLVSFCVCYVTVSATLELRNNCNYCTLWSKFEIDHKTKKRKDLNANTHARGVHAYVFAGECECIHSTCVCVFKAVTVKWRICWLTSASVPLINGLRTFFYLLINVCGYACWTVFVHTYVQKQLHNNNILLLSAYIRIHVCRSLVLTALYTRRRRLRATLPIHQCG